ncbi:hypothetical protein EYF80_019792 [Liparis tanakae]|uniref:Uncharacterized protein n=1 Tax=Liparis tanakae TaxID=230148 RepID=A0A4Z2HVQ4_9TELE|nr:hypothetical protein EYF80_019792 [Liparis tanakae]
MPLMISTERRPVVALYTKPTRISGVERKVSVKIGHGPLAMPVLALCFLVGSSTRCTCQEMLPVRFTAGRSDTAMMVTASCRSSKS